MAAPNYTDNGGSAPTYSASVTDGERILELQPSLSASSINLPEQYVFQSERIKLDLGARVWPFATPCFGYKGTIEGVVSTTTLEHVKSLTIKLEATVKTLFMERGVPVRHTESNLFQRSVTIYKDTSGSSKAILKHPIALNFPATCDESTSPLPPSFERFLPGASVEVRYRIRVDMSRSGLRRRESLIVPILYLPRSHAPPHPQHLPCYDDHIGPPCGTQGMEELHLVPKSIQKASKHNVPPVTDVQAKIALPSPLVVASGDRIPFVITIISHSQALAALFTDISLQLVKITKIKAPQMASRKEEILASGEVYNSEGPGNGTRVLRGELGNGVPGAELSWSAAGTVEVRHVIRLSLKPPACRIALSTNLPMFENTIPVEIMTHRYTPDLDIETALPALGLIGLNAT